MNIRVTLLLVAALAVGGRAQETNTTSNVHPLKGKSIEELMDMPVTSVGRKPTRFVEAATAIDVITDEEIRRSGATTFPDILRLATGIQVAQSSGRDWGITARGFNLTTANKMLVLMDGRSLYTPLFAGVLWDAPDYLLADIDRIEVIRGPGATMWGANAVNGVISINSKSARDTQGTLLTAASGTEVHDILGVRYGGKSGENTFFRVYGKHSDYDDMILRNGDGDGAHDDREHAQGGFRMDSYLWEKNIFTVQGDYYRGWNGQLRGDDEEIGGGNLLTRWTHQFTDKSDVRVQLYYDRVERHVPDIFREHRNTYAADVQYRFQPSDRFTTGDDRLLRLVLENLLGNAFKFTRKKPVAEIEFGARILDGKRVLFVRDNGAGFNMLYASKLFGPFQRLHAGTEYPGTGIGLATVHRIIARHGGTIWPESKEGEGTTFYFTLPA